MSHWSCLKHSTIYMRVFHANHNRFSFVLSYILQRRYKSNYLCNERLHIVTNYIPYFFLLVLIAKVKMMNEKWNSCLGSHTNNYSLKLMLWNFVICSNGSEEVYTNAINDCNKCDENIKCNRFVWLQIERMKCKNEWNDLKSLMFVIHLR